MNTVHGHNRKTENYITLTLETWTAFHLAFWPSLAAVVIAILAMF